MIDELLDHADTNLDRSRERLFDLLRIPSISTQPQHAGGVCRADQDRHPEMGPRRARVGCACRLNALCLASCLF